MLQVTFFKSNVNKSLKNNENAEQVSGMFTNLN
jgi:hypothetical protein